MPSFPRTRCEDVVFGMDFIHRDALASASRDGSLRIFRLPRETSEEECAVCASERANEEQGHMYIKADDGSFIPCGNDTDVDWLSLSQTSQ